jgi:hypothetical protein
MNVYSPRIVTQGQLSCQYPGDWKFQPQVDLGTGWAVSAHNCPGVAGNDSDGDYGDVQGFHTDTLHVTARGHHSDFLSFRRFILSAAVTPKYVQSLVCLSP